MSRLLQCACLVGILPVLSGWTFAAGDEDTKPAADKPPESIKTHKVESGDVVLRVEREGRIESAQKSKVRIIPDAFNGPFEVTELVNRGGPIRKGEVILRLDTRPYEKELASARQALDHARKNLELSREEQRIQAETNKTRLEQTAKARERTAKELGIWEKYDGPDMLKQGELGMLSRQFNLADEKQELQQLEDMYKGTHLATETKEIVLDRARRNVKMNTEWLELGKHDDVIMREIRHPDRDKDVRDQARWSAEEDEHTKFSAAAGEARKAMELQDAEKNLKDSEERYTKLQGDGRLFEIAAPQDGVLTKIDLEPRDTIGPRTPIAEVLNPSMMIVKFPVTAEDLRVVGPKGDITLSLPEYPDVAIAGAVKDVADIGERGEGSTQFPMTVALTNPGNDLVRLGLRCKIYASRTLSNVLSIPKGAVKWKDGKAWCKVRTATGSEERAIGIGPTNDTMTVVTTGLKAGDEVVIEEEKK